MKKIIILIVAVISVVFFVESCKNKETKKENAKIETEDVHAKDSTGTKIGYQCPMDCEHGKTYAEKGSCPVCKMKMVKAYDTKNETSCTCKDGGACICKKGECKCDTEATAMKCNNNCVSKNCTDKKEACKSKSGCKDYKQGTCKHKM